ncbi:MarR family transcriptional regulator [Clostridium bowmanii]|uniref:MarR family winged helix-turn-helix transcriptional regulator n=1 Tax=Clostridium bowmanii TaxID=132925 RepID=UPI001C0AA9B6|nr:MarR family transcriptional regulator [Clostridium bowmanii]MBU3189906.1 MarR family transcriptional regulator [Clostridium bowmanii]MCA1074390.1 MarR family transcriptional regulator [Clostridium bowmanii]
MNENYDENIIKIEFLLRKICFGIKKRGRVILNDYKITPPQFDALQCLINNGGLSISDLSTKLFQAPSTITDLVDRMENSHLVERSRDVFDRRVVKVNVLQKGYNIINKVLNKRCEFVNEALKLIDSDDKIEFIKHLDIVYNSSFCSFENK